MHAFQRARRVKRPLRRNPEQLGALDQQKWANPLAAIERAIAHGLFQALGLGCPISLAQQLGQPCFHTVRHVFQVVVEARLGADRVVLGAHGPIHSTLQTAPTREYKPVK